MLLSELPYELLLNVSSFTIVTRDDYSRLCLVCQPFHRLLSGDDPLSLTLVAPIRKRILDLEKNILLSVVDGSYNHRRPGFFCEITGNYQRPSRDDLHLLYQEKVQSFAALEAVCLRETQLEHFLHPDSPAGSGGYAHKYIYDLPQFFLILGVLIPLLVVVLGVSFLQGVFSSLGFLILLAWFLVVVAIHVFYLCWVYLPTQRLVVDTLRFEGANPVKTFQKLLSAFFLAPALAIGFVVFSLLYILYGPHFEWSTWTSKFVPMLLACWLSQFFLCSLVDAKHFPGVAFCFFVVVGCPTYLVFLQYHESLSAVSYLVLQGSAAVVLLLETVFVLMQAEPNRGVTLMKVLQALAGVCGPLTFLLHYTWPCLTGIPIIAFLVTFFCDFLTHANPRARMKESAKFFSVVREIAFGIPTTPSAKFGGKSEE